MKKETQLFIKYVKNFNLRIPELMEKFHHTFRVMNFCEEIALSENLNEKDVYIAKLCGLLHDIGRFYQWTNYETFSDSKSIDHAEYAANLLEKDNYIKEYTTDEDVIKIVLTSIKYHNKYEIPEMDERTKLFVKIIRDADKFDIMLEQYNEIKEDEVILKDNLLEDIYSDRVCKKIDTKTSADGIIGMLSWISDLNFKYSYQFLLDRNIIKKKFELLEIYGTNEKLENLKKYINEKIKEMIEC